MFSGFLRSSGIVSSETITEIMSERRAHSIAVRRSHAAWVTFVVTTVGSCIWFVVATFIADYAVQPDMPFGLLIFFLFSLPCSVPLAGVAVILGRSVSLFRYSRILSGMILVGSVLWLLRLSSEAKAMSDRAWETDGIYEADPALYVFILFGLPPLTFGSFLFCFVANRELRRIPEEGG